MKTFLEHINENIFDQTLQELLAKGNRTDPADDPILNKHVETARKYFLKFATKNNWDETEAKKRCLLYITTAYQNADKEAQE